MSDKADGFTVLHSMPGVAGSSIYIAVIGEEYIGKTESFSSPAFEDFASVNSRSLLGMSLQDSSEVVNS